MNPHEILQENYAHMIECVLSIKAQLLNTHPVNIKTLLATVDYQLKLINYDDEKLVDFDQLKKGMVCQLHAIAGDYIVTNVTNVGEGVYIKKLKQNIPTGDAFIVDVSMVRLK